MSLQDDVYDGAHRQLWPTYSPGGAASCHMSVCRLTASELLYQWVDPSSEAPVVQHQWSLAHVLLDDGTPAGAACALQQSLCRRTVCAAAEDVGAGIHTPRIHQRYVGSLFLSI